jgi:hypothetical protein
LLVVDGCEAIAEVIQRPRPVGIEILGPWKGYAMPSLPLAVLAVFLVNTLYAAVPAGLLAAGASSRWPACCFWYSCRGYTWRRTP